MGSIPAETAVRSTLGSYRLFDEVARDPLGVQYLACPAGAPSFPKWAVVRRLHAGVARDPVMVHAFLAATQAQVRMVHKNIAATFDFGGKMSQPWAAREHLLGVTAVDLIARLAATRTKVPWQVASYLVSEAAEGVTVLRGRMPSYGPPLGFLMGTVAMSVFVTQAGEVKLVDGCLPLVEGVPLIDSHALPYRPREPAGSGATAGRADAFGLSVLLWELVAGRRLFAGQDDGETSQLLDLKVVPPLRTTAKAPAALDEVLTRVLATDAGGRSPIGSAAELATELRDGLIALGERAGAGDLARLLGETVGTELTAQNDALARAWTQEQALQERGDLPADLAGDSELTRPNGATIPDTTTETAIAPRSGRRGEDGFDEMPTVPRSARPGAISWRAEALPQSLAPMPETRIDYLPDGSPPPPPAAPSPPPPPRVPAVILAPTPFPVPRLERPPLVLPPVDRGPEGPPSALAPIASPQRPPPPAPRPPSVLLVGALAFGLVAVGITLFALSEPTPPSGPAAATTLAATASPVPSAITPSVRRPPSRSTDPWTALPAGATSGGWGPATTPIPAPRPSTHASP